MRNLKRALSLALASVMLLGMMVVGTSAKGLDDFNDAAEIVNKDAVAVIAELGIMVGDDADNFNGDKIVTRAEAAVIVAKMLYGADVKVAQFAENNAFTDLQDWNAGYVNLVASLGIVAGYGDGKYGPNDQLTTAQFANILAKTLGWFQNEADYGNNWELAATAKGTEIGLYEGLNVSAKAGLTREDVAVMTFNALTKAIPVQYNSLLGVYYNENQGITNELEFDYLETLGYANFDLVYVDNAESDYGRPATTWGIGSYKNNGTLTEDGGLVANLVKMTSANEIVTVANTPDEIYTAPTDQDDVCDDLSKIAHDEYKWIVYVDGAKQAGSKATDFIDEDSSDDWTYTDEGFTTEIYVNDADDENGTVTVVVIKEYLAEVSKVDDDDDGDYVVVKSLDNLTVDTKKIYTEGFEKGDIVLVTVDCEDRKEGKDSFIATIADPEVVEGTVFRVRKQENASGTYVKLDDDSKHTYSSLNVYDVDANKDSEHPELDTEYALYLDSNGYVVGFKALEDYYANYLYVTATDYELNTITAKVVFADGTTAKIEVAEVDDVDADDIADISVWQDDNGAGKVYAYTEEDGVYALRSVLNVTEGSKDNRSDAEFKDYEDIQIVEAGEKKNDEIVYTAQIFNGAAFIESEATGLDYIVDEDTIFVDIDEKVVYTGFDAVPDYEKAGFVVIDREDDGVIDLVFITTGEPVGTDDTYFYVIDADDCETYNKSKKYREHVVYVDGVKGTMIFDNDTSNEIISGGDRNLYKVEKTNASGVVTEISSLETKGEDAWTYESGEAKVVGSRSFYLNVEGKKAPVQYVTTADTVIVSVELTDWDAKDGDYDDCDVAEGFMADMDDEDFDCTVYVLETSKDGDVADLIYIVKAEK